MKILIADDHQMFKEGLKKILSTKKDFNVVGEASSGEEAIRQALKIKPDIVLMDISMEGLSGLKAAARIIKKDDKIKVIIVSMFDDEAHLLEAIKAGASGYIVKSLPAEEVIKAINRVYQKKEYYPENVTPKIIDAIRTMSRPKMNNSSFALTERETQLLKFVSKGMSNKKISKELNISVKTVKNHLVTIYKKLEVKNRTQAVVKAIKKNIVSI
jgi:DNA-binding NarL/FixJ family response regulator